MQQIFTETQSIDFSRGPSQCGISASVSTRVVAFYDQAARLGCIKFSVPEQYRQRYHNMPSDSCSAFMADTEAQAIRTAVAQADQWYNLVHAALSDDGQALHSVGTVESMDIVTTPSGAEL